MRSPSGLSSIFAGLLYCLAITAGSAWAQIALPAYGTINTVAGVGTSAYSGDSGPAINAELYTPQGLAVDASGNIYIADSQNSRIRKVAAATGIITTVAGTGIAGYSGDGMLAASTGLNNPSGVAVDSSGNIYIADTQNNRVRKVTASTGIIISIAGNGTAGYNGDAQAAIEAELNGPRNLVLDKYGNIYIADTLNNRIRELGLRGEITTVAGIGVAGYSGDGEQANTAKISGPIGLAMDANGNLFFADSGNLRIRKVTIFTGIITTIVGNGTAGFAGDNGSAMDAEFNRPSGVAVDASGNLYATDSWNNRVRAVGAGTTGGSAPAVKSMAVRPMTNSFCAPGYMNFPTGLPGSGGTWTGTFSYTSLSFPGCTLGTSNLSSDSSWLTLNFYTLSCSPNPAPLGQTVTCSMTYNAAQNTGPSRQGTITANYSSAGSTSANVLQYGPLETLTVGVSGGGSVSSNPSGISCPGICLQGFSYGTIVNLTASPSAGYSFSGWSGACSGTGACSFTMISPTSVSATFTPLPPTFTVTLTQPSQTTPLSMGHSMTYAVSVSPQYGFTGTVALSVSGLPAGVTAHFSSTSINTAGSATLTLTSAYSNSTFIGSSGMLVIGTSGSLSKYQGFNLKTQPLQYKGTCGVP